MLFWGLLFIGALYLIGVLIDLIINKKDKRPNGFREGQMVKVISVLIVASVILLPFIILMEKMH